MYWLHEGSFRTAFSGETPLVLLRRIMRADRIDSPPLEGGEIYVYDSQEWAAAVDGMCTAEPGIETEDEAAETGADWLRSTGLDRRINSGQIVVNMTPATSIHPPKPAPDIYRVFDQDIDLADLNAMFAEVFPDNGYRVVEEA